MADGGVVADLSETAPGGHFGGKPKARKAVWDRLEAAGVARPPLPPHERIPNFEGAERAAERLFELPLVSGARRMKVNRDASLRRVRELALERGIELFVPTPELRDGYRRLDPRRIPAEHRARSALLLEGDEYAEAVAVADLPQVEVIVVGSVAVTRRGDRCGRGAGTSDLEYAILRELGHAPAPVVTTVHPLQFVDLFPTYGHDLPLSHIATPEGVSSIEMLAPTPRGIDWERLSPEQLDAMPVLRALQPR